MLRIKEAEESVTTEKTVTGDDILGMQAEAKRVSMSDEVAEYITKLVSATRTDIHVIMGGSPRADISLMMCGKAKALIEGRHEVSIEDIKRLARPVLSHRILVRSTGGVGVNGIIDGIVATLH
jgi:MoxR-like ATPase